MRTEVSIEQLLRWRLACAEAEAPPPPRAARLLERARPWWERSPERFRALLDSLIRVEVAVGFTMAESHPPRARRPVPALLVRADQQTEAFVRVLYLSVRDGQLHFRFQLDTPSHADEPTFEVTFVANSPAQPLFSAQATRTVENEYRLDAEVSAETLGKWDHLKVTDRMPFRLILRREKHQTREPDSTWRL